MLGIVKIEKKKPDPVVNPEKNKAFSRAQSFKGGYGGKIYIK